MGWNIGSEGDWSRWLRSKVTHHNRMTKVHFQMIDHLSIYTLPEILPESISDRGQRLCQVAFSNTQTHTHSLNSHSHTHTPPYHRFLSKQGCQQPPI